MNEYICSLCGRRLYSDETIQHCDQLYDELYVICPYCRGECYLDTEEEILEMMEIFD